MRYVCWVQGMTGLDFNDWMNWRLSDGFFFSKHDYQFINFLTKDLSIWVLPIRRGGRRHQTSVVCSIWDQTCALRPDSEQFHAELLATIRMVIIYILSMKTVIWRKMSLPTYQHQWEMKYFKDLHEKWSNAELTGSMAAKPYLSGEVKGSAKRNLILYSQFK